MAATLDLVSGGRLELGIGAGWMRSDYEAAGLAYDRPGVRIDRLGGVGGRAEGAVHAARRSRSTACTTRLDELVGRALPRCRSRTRRS